MLDGQSGASDGLLQRHLHLLERLVDLGIQPLRVVDRQLHRDTREKDEKLVRLLSMVVRCGRVKTRQFVPLSFGLFSLMSTLLHPP